MSEVRMMEHKKPQDSIERSWDLEGDLGYCSVS